MDVIFVLLWCSFLVPSLKNTALIFLHIFVIECCSVLVEPPMTSSLFLFAYYKTKISPKQTEKHHSSFLWKAFQISSNFFFHFIGTLITMIFFKKSPHQLASWLPVNVLNNVLFVCIAIHWKIISLLYEFDTKNLLKYLCVSRCCVLVALVMIIALWS